MNDRLATDDLKLTTVLLKSPFPFNYLGDLLYRHLERRLAEHIREFLRRQYGVEPERIVIEQPPKVEFGEFALPLAFELAKKLRKAPRKIAEEIVAGIGAVEGFEKFEVAGAGYINARVDRGAVAAAIVKTKNPPQRFPRERFWSSTPVLIPTKRLISDTCATRSWAIPSSACCNSLAAKWTCRITLTTPACRSQM